VRLLLLCLVLLPGGAEAGQVQDSDVSDHDGVYRVIMKMEINAGYRQVRDIVTDYGNIARLSRLIRKSSLVEAPDGGIRRRLKCHVCILFFCSSPVIVEDVHEVNAHTIDTTVVPALSDFKSGYSQWRITVVDASHTLIRFEYVLEPDFWIPPLIGPPIIRNMLLDEAKHTINRIEKLARG